MWYWGSLLCILGKTAILSALGSFISIDEDDSLIAKNKKAGEAEHCTIRSLASRIVDTKSSVPTEERGNLDEIEENYVLVLFEFFIIITEKLLYFNHCYLQEKVPKISG